MILIPICEKCHNKWTWKQTVKKTFSLYPKMTCPYCGEIQYQTMKSKGKSFFFNSIVLLPLLLNIFFDIPGVIILSLFPILFILMMLIFPFFVEISNRDQFGNKP